MQYWGITLRKLRRSDRHCILLTSWWRWTQHFFTPKNLIIMSNQTQFNAVSCQSTKIDKIHPWCVSLQFHVLRRTSADHLIRHSETSHKIAFHRDPLKRYAWEGFANYTYIANNWTMRNTTLLHDWNQPRSPKPGKRPWERDWTETLLELRAGKSNVTRAWDLEKIWLPIVLWDLLLF